MSLSLTHTWAEVVIEELSRLGIRHICVAPGSRSTPLTLAAVKQSQHPQRPVTIHRHFDERGLGYLALGLAKSICEPVAVIVTSGTAVANLLPAVVESGLTGEPLVILSADRPFELMDCGANQAITQSGLFSSHVTAELALPAPTAEIPLPALLTKVDQLLARQAEQGGSVHINCPFREPFYGNRDETEEEKLRESVAHWWQSGQRYTRHHQARCSAMPEWPPWWTPTDGGPRTVIVLGAVPEGLSEAVERLANSLHAIILADPQAGVASSAPGYDLWLNHPDLFQQLNQAQWVIQLGGRLVSKRLGQWLAQTQAHYWLISEHTQSLAPHHLSVEQFVVPPSQWRLWLNALTDAVDSAHSDAIADSTHVSAWQCALVNGAKYQMQLAAAAIPTSPLSEHNVFQTLPAMLPHHADVFIGNSLAIRLADIWSHLAHHRVFANRGASGIDGLLACAAGVQRYRAQPMLVVLGDTSALYDLNSLALWRETSAPAAILILNNNGGGIFDALPVDQTLCDTYYRMPHDLGFEHIAAQFSLGFHQPVTPDDLVRSVSQALTTPGADVIEVVTPAGEAGQVLSECLAAMAARGTHA
ncbi:MULTISPECIES: 2-succinyl-5-enolpyruvyl-6-hydroxy-3-cyclohexene-1-carboxylic-acid synthase [unclassified Salinivibrio]|uniref:2-succinyl-5-enolpyruvyl-6-hydroxy-3- cyclohexene-1-carboxylic-acid synthase n=1 Tax=unclassified Salinivibrio TaxID=2636825 RepID=UPI000988C261|nr:MULTISPECIES: 2-succinyl-5-enolpyruvyl-6-hydroxy-3-cyclohexene-1-carboxylic-acid synthase [unclassified Salinivibrio]MPS32534.1 2-succinyl-5-enolpyruvyl-6-hydroxy-3-cyclohexene-1-carboxylic-acid synthase [Salinivibrio sp. VYel7]MPX90545.1 2-succinyl-5-enolpyruvyl-6-hydroxy-3-cyclohexene-1-carboxylic-acid synthase [Salinivibrio sp. VYel1]MPX93925.1 2-succinyl-5-enolpyruvyl-6-hydroxy-3-cyclohexene-1-carboxylic-acid synthase [Salinivibrio sp. VYel9]MPX96162.1 2-succinyl-5-enolpyruvyl-6-hydroxy-